MYSEVIFFYLAVSSCSLFLSTAHPIDETTHPTSETENEAKFTVEIRFENLDCREVVECNGGILANNIIVTAASCVINNTYKYDGIFRYVSYKTLERPHFESLMQADAFIHSIYVPRSYNSTTLRDNIAVLKLDRPIDLKKHGLKKLELSPRAFKVGDVAEITTIGLTNKTYASVVGKKTYKATYEVPFNVTAHSQIIDNTECQKEYPELDRNGNLCAELVEPDREFMTCKFKKMATRGSVLVNRRNNLIGLLAHTRNLCNKSDDVQIYTDVSAQLDFILNAMNNQGLDNMYYFNLLVSPLKKIVK